MRFGRLKKALLLGSLMVLVTLLFSGQALAKDINLNSWVDDAVSSGAPVNNLQMGHFVTTLTGGGGTVAIGPVSVDILGTVVASDILSVDWECGTAGTVYSTTSPGSKTGITITATGGGCKTDGNHTFYLDLAGSAAGKTVGLRINSPITGAIDNIGLPVVSSTVAITAPATHDLVSWSGSASTVNPDNSQHTFATITSAASNGGTDIVNWPITINDGGSGLTAGNVTVYVEYNGVQVGSGSPASIGTQFNIAAAGTQNGGNDWTFKVAVNGAGEDGKQIQLVVGLPAAGNDTGASLPQSTALVNVTLAGAGMDCHTCHGDGVSKDYPVDGARSTAGAALGNHAAHADGWLNATHGVNCNTCHVDSSGYTSVHLNTNIEMIGTIASGFYDKDGDGNNAPTSWAQNNSAAAGDMGNCDNTVCHGNDDSPNWGTSGPLDCHQCHGDRASTDYPTATNVFRSAAAAGAHAAHMTGAGSIIDGGVVCGDCHASYTNINDAGHFDLAAPADVDMSGGTGGLNAYAVDWTSPDCANYCHDGSDKTGNNTNLIVTPNWTDTNAGTCDFCHGYPPTNGASQTHDGITNNCDQCHEHVNTTDDGFLASGTPGIDLHINGTVDIAGCTGCHGNAGASKEYPPVAYWVGTADGNTADGVGAHVLHIEGTAALMSKEVIGGEADTTGYWCAECHTTTRGAGGHNDGYPAEVQFTNAVESAYGTVTEAFTAAGGGSAGPDDGTGGSCVTYCHSAYDASAADTKGTNTQPAWTDNWANYNAGSCSTACHLTPPQTAAHDKGGATYYALNECNGCHPDTVTDTLAMPTIDPAFHINGALNVDASCTGCHSSPAHVSKVGVGSPHMALTRGGADAACEACHPGNLKGAQHQKSGDANVVLIANNTNLGINYVSGTNGYTGDNGIVLGGDNTVGTTEAEICWNCHDDSNPDISEWDGSSVNSAAKYDYGSVTQNDLNWFTTTWESANFSYKDGPLTTAINTDGDPASTHGTKGGAAGVDSEGQIGCTYCHDVHDTNKTTGDTFSGAPYLRGSWMSSVYNEDGAPGRYVAGTGMQGSTDTTTQGTTYAWNSSGSNTYLDGNSYGDVPRADAATTNGMGGYWIDQNSAAHGATTYADHAGLCTLCHGDGDGIPAEATDVDAIEALWAGHENPVAGGNKGGTNNLYRMTNTRNGDGTWSGGMWMGAKNSTYRTGGTRGGSYRNVNENAFGVTTPDSVTGNAYAYNNFAWTDVSMDDTTVDTGMHNFTCSKCHNPHASRLPALLITNCLNVKRNTWDDAGITDTNMKHWDGTAPGGFQDANVNYGTGEHAYASTAQNCHRYTDSAASEPGWNAVSPWE